MRNKIIRFGLKWITGIPFSLLAFLVAILSLNAADFKGAAVVLREAAETDSTPKVKDLDPNEPLRNKLKAFQAQSTNLALLKRSRNGWPLWTNLKNQPPNLETADAAAFAHACNLMRF